MRPTLLGLALLASACTGVVTGAPGAPPDELLDQPPQVPTLQCAEGQSEPLFVGLLGDPLEARLEPLDPAYDQVRPLDTKTYWDNTRISLIKTVAFLAGGETLWLQGKGLDVYESCNVAQVFGLSCSSVERQELLFTAVGTHVLYEMAWKSCLAAQAAALKTTPLTPENARAYCQTRQRWAYGREPSAEELDECVALAADLETQLAEPALEARWAHVCAAVVISTPSIAY